MCFRPLKPQSTIHQNWIVTKLVTYKLLQITKKLIISGRLSLPLTFSHSELFANTSRIIDFFFETLKGK